MSGWETISIIIVGLIVAAIAASGRRALNRYSRSALQEICDSRQLAGRFAEIVARHGKAAVAADCLATLAMAVAAVAAGAQWAQSTADSTTLETGVTVGLIARVAGGLALVWLALVWLPAMIWRLRGETFLVRTWPLWNFLRIVFTPVLWIGRVLDWVVERIAGHHSHPLEEETAEDEILTIASEGHRGSHLEENAREMIEGVIEMSEAAVAQIMTPRMYMESIQVDTPWPDAVERVLHSGHSRVPVFGKSRDEILGFLHVKDLLSEMARGNPDARPPLKDILRKPYFVPETKPVRDLLEEFQNGRNHIAVVLDEFGGVSGLVTIEDVLEEIVGEIADEYDDDLIDGIKTIDENTCEALARLSISELNERLGLNLPDDEHFDTIGGFVFHELGRIPAVGEEFVWQDVRIRVLDATRRRIDRVAIHVHRPSQPTA